MKHKIIWLLAIACVVVVVDQATKYLAMYLLQGKGVISLMGDCLRFLFAENRGGFLSLGANLSEFSRQMIFLVLTTLFLLAFFVYTLYEKSNSPVFLLASSMIIGGGVGNLIDRAVRDGAVIDFVNVGVGGLRTGIFNVADMAVLFGCILMFFSMNQKEDKSVPHE